VFLMDEPLSNLDAKLRNQMRAEIIKLRQRIDTTFIYVTHDQTEAMTLGDRIVIMKDGFIQQVGTPQEVFEHPVNVFVAGFIGTPQMNFFDAHLTKQGDSYSVTCNGAAVELPEKLQQKLRDKSAADQDIVLGIRPEHISFESGPDGAGVLTGTVDVSEMMGSELHLHVSMPLAGKKDETKDVVMRVATMDLPEQFHGGVPHGTKLAFSFPGALVHLFHKDTEENLI
jgi:multiple sugar transport system ATP-binding protein